jgi:hypothetical protein
MAQIYSSSEGDDEIPPEYYYLIVTSAILGSEDVCVLTEILVWKFVNLAKEASSR